MGDACSSCCSSGEVALSRNINMEERQSFLSSSWIAAVRDDSYDGCKIIGEDDPQVINSVVDAITGEVALHFACRNKNIRLVSFLCQKGAEISAPGKSRDTPLHVAARANNEKIIVLLLSWGADPSIKNQSGQVAKDLCSKENRKYFKQSNVDKLRKLGPPEKMRVKSKRDEISARGDKLITNFGRKVGCEVDEIALFLQDMNPEAKTKVWDKFASLVDGSKNVSRGARGARGARGGTRGPRGGEAGVTGETQTKLLAALARAVLRNKGNTEAQPDEEQMQALSGLVTLKNDGHELILNDFTRKLHIWLYQIHHSKEWQKAR